MQTKKNQLARFLKLLPGMCGVVARYVDSRLEYSRPAISIPAAIAFCGAVKSGKYYIGSSGVGAAPYCCTIAGSGTGKSQAQSAIEDIVAACGLEDMMLGEPGSDAGLLKALGVQPVRLLVWDEFGHSLRELENATQGHKALMIKEMMKLHTCQGRKYRGRELAGTERIDVEGPYLTILAATTPNRFYSAVSTAMVHDGFMGRWLVFFQDELDFTERPSENREIPHSILTHVETLNSFAEAKSSGNISAAIGLYEKKPVKFECEDTFRSFSLRMKRKEADCKEEFERVFWSRAAVHFERMCIILSDPNGRCSSVDCLTAFELVEYIINTCIERCKDNLGMTQKVQTRQAFLDKLAIGETLSRSKLMDRAKRIDLSIQERSALINEAVDLGHWIEEVRHESPNTHRKSTYYTRVS